MKIIYEFENKIIAYFGGFFGNVILSMLILLGILGVMIVIMYIIRAVPSWIMELCFGAI